METFPFKPDQKSIERRRSIKPFGRFLNTSADQYLKRSDVAPKFIRAVASEQILEEEIVSKSNTGGVYIFRGNLDITNKDQTMPAEGIYVPPSMRQKSITIRIINLPTEYNKYEIEALVTEISKHIPNWVHIVTDRDTGESRGCAFANFMSEEIAKEAIKNIDGSVHDGLIIGAEMARR